MYTLALPTAQNMPGIALATVMVLLALGLGNESAIRACASKPCARKHTHTHTHTHMNTYVSTHMHEHTKKQNTVVFN